MSTATRRALAHHFDTPVQQFEAAKLGMWLFLGQEVLFFGGLFVAYGVFRTWYPEMFSAAAHQLDRTMGAVNTLVLLASSLTAALAVRSAQIGERRRTSFFLAATIACAITFLLVKYFEYSHKLHAGLLPGAAFAPSAEHLLPGPELAANSHIFFGLYFALTALHGLHVLVGIGVLAWLLVRNNRGAFSPGYFTPVDLGALYWHLVDLVWIFIFPLLYLID